MTDNVVNIDDLKKQKVIRELEDDADLDPVASNEKVIGVLTENERAVFLEIMELVEEIQDILDDNEASMLEHLAEITRNRKDKKGYQQEIKKIAEQQMAGLPDGPREEFSRLTVKKDYLNAMLWYIIRDRLGVYGQLVGIRQGFSIICASNHPTQLSPSPVAS